MDSPLEGSGFEPSVPRQKGNGFEALSETGRSAGRGRRYHPSICPPSAEGLIWRAEIRRAAAHRRMSSASSAKTPDSSRKMLFDAPVTFTP